MNPIFMYAVYSTIAVAAVMSSLFLLRLVLGLGPLIARLEAIVKWLEEGRPRYVQILVDLEAQLGELRGISESARRMMGTAEGLTDGLRSAAQPIIDDVKEFSRATRHARAALLAVRAGLSVLLHNRGDADSAPGISNRSNQESRVEHVIEP